MLSALVALAVLNQSPESFIDMQRLADGVYAAVRKEPAGLAVDCNVVFIVNERDVVMVDSNIGPESAKATLSALRKITDKPVRYVIGTHYHDDHIGGNATVRAAYKDVEFIGHSSVAKALEVHAAPSRKQMIEIAPGMTKMLRDTMAKGKGLGGNDLTAEEKASYESDIRLADRYAKEMPHVEIIPPTLTVTDKLVLHRGGRTIEILHLGKGHTPSDLVVHLPNEKIVVAGDLIVYPVPLVGSTQSHVTEWAPTLEKMLDLKPAIIVPGHGPVMRDDSYVRSLIAFYRSVTEQVRAAVAKGSSLEATQKAVDLQDLERSMAGSSLLKRFLFRIYGKEPSVAAAYRELTTK